MTIAAAPLDNFVSLVEHLLAPLMTRTGLYAETVRQIGGRLFAAQMPTNNLGFLVSSEVSALLRNSFILL